MIRPDSMPDDRQTSPEVPSRAAVEHAAALLRACDCPPPATDSDPERTPAAEWATSGAMHLTGPAEGTPRFVAGALASAANGLGLALRSLAPGVSDWAKLDAAALLGERAVLSQHHRAGTHSAGGSARLLATRDATLVVNLPRDDDWHLLPAWLESESPFTPSPPDWTRLTEALKTRSATPLVERARLLGLAVAVAERELLPPPPFFVGSHESESPPPALAQSGSRLRVLDLSSLWAGPLAASLLAEAGCDVLKIESPARPDGARLGPKPFFDRVNGGKRGAALDLREKKDRALFERLLEAADVVLESARPRGLEQLGFDSAGWVSARPGRLWASITGYGRENPGIAFGDDAAVAAGLAYSPNPRDTAPCFPADAIADPLTGLQTAAVLLAFLTQGRGARLDFSLRDVAVRSAHASTTNLTAPIEDRSERAVIRVGETPIEIAPPRSRRILKEAPPLARRTETELAAWMAAPC